MGRAEAAVERTSPEALFALSGITQYTGAVIAVRLFEDAPPTAVVWLRGLTAAVILLLVSGWWRQRWTRHDLGRAAIFGVVTALMNLFFYLAINRIPLGKSVVIEFVGPVALAAVLTRTVRNSVALVLAATGVIVLSGVEIDHEPLGLLFIAAASAMWAGYIVLGRRVAGLNRGTAGLAVSLGVGAVALAPVGAYRSAPLFTSGHLLGLAALVGLLSTAIPYGLDQYVMRRIPTRRFALLLALLPVTAMVVGLLALDQRPTTVDLIGAALVVSGVIVQERDELAPAEPPG